MEEEVLVTVIGVGQDQQRAEFVLLRDEQRRCLPIWIGPWEALAILMKLEETIPRRPMTHDLMNSIIEKLGARVEKIVVDDLSNNTFYAKVYLTIDGREVIVDSRPSDAIALALRAEAPIYVAESVMQQASIPEERLEFIAEEEPPGDEPFSEPFEEGEEGGR